MSLVGYHYCTIPDCFELYVGNPGERCHDCEENQCEEHCECPHNHEEKENAND